VKLPVIFVMPAVAALLLLSGCATTTGGEASAADYDPYESFNRRVFAFNNQLERRVFRPVSTVYLSVTPQPVRDGVQNFFTNLGYPSVVLNDLLQGKYEQGMTDAGRFVFNSTLGLGGMVDIASGMGFERHYEDFGQTLALWGVDEGIFLELPLIGPRTLRDLPGIPVSIATNVQFYADIGLVGYPLSLLSAVDRHSRLLPSIKIRDKAALDPYIFQREAYRQRRQEVIHQGDPLLYALPDLFS